MVSTAGLLEAITGSLIIALGLVSALFALLGRSTRDRAPLWFGLFACLYGVRLSGRSELLQPLFPEVFWRYLDAFITYTIIVPGGLFIESLFGPGWRLTLRRVWQAAALYASLAIAHDLARGEPGATLWLNPPAVLMAGGIAMAHVLYRWRRESWPGEFRVAAGGGMIFACAALYETFGGTVHVEPAAMLIFLVSVAYLVARRILAGERRLVAVSRELDLAREIQQSILPRARPEIPGLRVAARYLPMSDVAGDFYDFDTSRADHLGIIVADVSGHGVPAALVASMVKIAFAAESERLDAPGLALTNINRTLSGRFTGAYVTACCGVIDAAGRRLRYASAGHPAPLLRRSDGRMERLDGRGIPLVLDAGARYAGAEVSLGPGDRLLFFSDGLLEASNADDAFFGDARFEQIVTAGASLDPGQFVDQLVSELRRWIGAGRDLQDDVTVVVVDVG